MTYACQCQPGWQGDRCEKKVNYCESAKCENNGVCRALLGNFTCECLADSYSGRHCEHTDNRIVVYRTLSKSFAAVAISAMGAVAIFIIVMDVLKYWFGIDPVQRKSRPTKTIPKKKTFHITRYIYVPGPSATDRETSV